MFKSKILSKSIRFHFSTNIDPYYLLKVDKHANFDAIEK